MKVVANYFHEIVLFRSIIGFCLTLFIIVPLEGGFKVLKTKRPFIHFLRGLFLVLANMLFFTGLAMLSLAECSAIFFISPLLITINQYSTGTWLCPLQLKRAAKLTHHLEKQ